ncbi:DUF742 domain-containing protein [Streptomyces sp. NBC_01275]|uniref:DUF742 domain-containing protein n=1 Tax=Streptomyces sp. NBC_01275 TaxID=2903807 RepID=UPI00225A63A3|nr:DUF742 domain-containing protein [Streptomyces sp. NBC_01275]MCX4761927.1 DUF742 domain-containing protein [Streptomyces sp. NBC_01275]
MNSRSGPDSLAASDETAGIVRLYAVTDGRTRARHRLSMHTVLGPGRRPPRSMPEESVQIVELCRQHRRPLAELAGTLSLHVAAVTVLVSDLIDAGALKVHVPVAPGENRDVQTLMAVSAGLKRRWPGAEAKAG